MKTKIKATARSHCGPVRKADKAALGGGRGGGAAGVGMGAGHGLSFLT